MAAPIANGTQQFRDESGIPLAGGTVAFYIPSTETPKDTWQNTQQTILNSNPVQLDAGGTALIWGNGSYRQIVKDSNGVTIWDQETLSVFTSTTTFLTPAKGANSMIQVGGGTAIPLVVGPVLGGYITNPPNDASQGVPAENAYVDPVAPCGSTDATGNGTTTILLPGQTYTIPPLATGTFVYGNAATSGHNLTVVTW